VRDAIAYLDRNDEPMLRRADAALRHNHPPQHAYVCAQLAPAQGAAAVVSTATFLDRLDALESGADRAATREADHAALATLEERGITKVERANLRELLKIAMSAAEVVAPPPPAALEARQKDLVALWRWYDEWSDVARAVITRKSDLILLGLGRRKKAEKAQAPSPSAPKPA
jgi:hypothetical protein